MAKQYLRQGQVVILLGGCADLLQDWPQRRDEATAVIKSSVDDIHAATQANIYALDVSAKNGAGFAQLFAVLGDEVERMEILG